MQKTKKSVKKSGSSDKSPPEGLELGASLHDIAESRYLNYALSVITSRALPDVRDGLKPVQRRILYTMFQQRLLSDAKHRKCAKVVGDVMGNYHPHGESSSYDAVVRLAQDFSMRLPLVNGSGNFGSLDGDSAAAMRYTECRMAVSSEDLIREISEDTVHFRPSYDGSKFEPVVLPAKFPNLLINGSTGIAVGMATNIPPHNPEEVVSAAVRLLDAMVAGNDLSSRELCRTIKGPDFPTGGQIVSSSEEIKSAYETGTGSVKVRATYEIDTNNSKATIVRITSIPYAVNKSVLVERIADVVIQRKMPLLVDVRDLSTEDVCIELEIKKDADPNKVMAYLFKNTPLQSNFSMNLTCLVATENPDVCRPERLDLRSILWHFLQFRVEVVVRRLRHELSQLEKRIHILEGFATVFDALDEIIRIIRKSEGKADAASKIMKRFELDDEQTDAILELKLYRLAKLEILVIKEELEAKRKRAKAIGKLLNEKRQLGIWAIVREELSASFSQLPKELRVRRTIIEEVEAEEEFRAEELIIAEDNHVLVTKDGWIKRQKEIKDPSTTRLREGDAVLACVAGSTRETIVFFSNLGTCYTARIADIPATTGYGEPIQKYFKLKDGESIIAAYSLDPRQTGGIEEVEGYFPYTYAIAAMSDGYGCCFGLQALYEPSTRTGRKYTRPKDEARVIDVKLVHGDEHVAVASVKRRAIIFKLDSVNYLASAGRGVVLIKLEDDDNVLGIGILDGSRDALTVKTSMGGEQRISTSKFSPSARGGKGREVTSRGTLTEIVLPPIESPVLEEQEGSK